MPFHLNEWFESKPHPVFEHPTLGPFSVEGGVWKASIPQGTGSLELSLAGSESAPDEKLLASASALLARFSEVKETALAFLLSQEEAPNKEDFTCYDLELLREDCPDHFSLRTCPESLALRPEPGALT